MTIIRKLSTTTIVRNGTFVEEMQKNYVPTNVFQRTLLSFGAAAVALINPYRGDMIACLGEVTGDNALQYMRKKMLETPEGAEILNQMPRINSKTVSFHNLGQLPEDTVGRIYADFMRDNNITADSRLPVQFIADPNLAYVMQRYREVHDLVHATLFMKTTMLGEWNAQSFLPKLSSFKNLLLQEKIHIASVCETWLNDENLIKIKDYIIYRCDRDDSNGGVAVFVHRSIKSQRYGAQVAVKWIEGIQTKLPMCISGGIWGAARLKPKHRHLYINYYLPWAIRTGINAKFLQGIYYEKRWEQNINDFHKEMNIFKLFKK